MYKLEDLVLGEDKYNLSMLTNHSITFDLRLCSRIFDDAQKLALIEYAMIYYTKNMDKENATNIMKKIDPTNMFNNSIDNFLDLKFEQHNEKKLKLEDFKRAFIDTNFKYANTGTKN